MSGSVQRPSVYQNSAVGPVMDLITAEIRRTPGYVNVLSMDANTAQTLTVPNYAEWVAFNACNSTGTAQIAYFVCDAAVATAALPSGAVSNGTASEFMPSMYNVRQNSTSGLSIITPTAGYVIATFYFNPSTSQAV